VVEQTSGRGNDDRGAAPERIELRSVGDATDDQSRTPAIAAEPFGPDMGLLGQLPRRCKHRATPRSSRSCSMIGTRNAAVLPVPVWADPRTSRPARAGSIAAAWIGVGTWYPLRPVRQACGVKDARCRKLLLASSQRMIPFQ